MTPDAGSWPAHADSDAGPDDGQERETDAAATEAETARPPAENRPVVHDQEPSGEQGITSDKRGVDPEGYPGEPNLHD